MSAHWMGGGLPRGVCIPAYTEADTPWTELLTHTCKNIKYRLGTLNSNTVNSKFHLV